MADTLIRKNRQEILEDLNKSLRAEVKAVRDYNAHAEAIPDEKLSSAMKALRDVEEEHATRLRQRIQELGGVPGKFSPAPPASASLREMLTQDLVGEQWAIGEYARMLAGILDDPETVDLLTELLIDEIRHANWLKAKLAKL